MFARCRSRIQQAIVEIGDASSGFLQFVAMGYAVIDAARFSTVIATRYSLMRPLRRSGTSSGLRTVRLRCVKQASIDVG